MTAPAARRGARPIRTVAAAVIAAARAPIFAVLTVAVAVADAVAIAVAVAVAIVLLGAGRVAAQPVAPPPAPVAPVAPPGDTGFIGPGGALLEIDDCPPPDPAASDAQLRARFVSTFARGEVLFKQGEYTGAVGELIGAYCIAGGFKDGRQVRYALLKDIGQAYERSLDYEKAIGYLARYLRELPASATADKRLFESRILVLQKLRGQVLVQTSPGGATVTLSNESGVAGRGASGRAIDVLGGTYTMLVELAGHEPSSQQVEVRIGKPFAFFVPLRPLRGRLSAQVVPGDAKVFLRDRSVERFVGIGRVDEELPTGKYVLVAEAADRLRVEQPVEVLPNRVNRMQLDLPPRPQFGRRQLVTFSSVIGASSTGGMLYALGNGGISGLGVAGGAALGLFGSYLYLPEQVPLGTSNLTITAGLAGVIGGVAGAFLVTGSGQVVQPAQGLTSLVAAGVGYYVGRRTDVSVGDAALFNSSVLWGAVVGGLFALSFDGEREISSGLVLSGLGMGTASGILMTRYFEISRRRAVLIDIGGLLGMIGGVAAQSLAYPSKADGSSSASNEHLANFVLGGVAVGLLGAGALTRNLDAPKLPVKPAVGVAAAGGGSAPVYGIAGSW